MNKLQLSAEIKTEKYTETVSFTEKIGGKDEVTLVFDDGKMLFVLKHLLTLASPMFEAMFDNEYKETKEMKVNLDGKIYGDILEFLKCIHPRIMKDIDESNILHVAPIAEEYQVLPLVKKCQVYMKKWIRRDLKKAPQNSKWYSYIESVNTALEVITVAANLGYDDICNYVATILGKYPSGIYESYETDRLNSSSWTWVENKEKVRKCRELFSKLPDALKYKTLLHRCSSYETNEFKS